MLTRAKLLEIYGELQDQPKISARDLMHHIMVSSLRGKELRLWQLAEAKGKVTTDDVRRYCQVSRTAASVMLYRLKQYGLLARYPAKGGRYRWIWKPTTEGPE